MLRIDFWIITKNRWFDWFLNEYQNKCFNLKLHAAEYHLEYLI